MKLIKPLIDNPQTEKSPNFCYAGHTYHETTSNDVTISYVPPQFRVSSPLKFRMIAYKSELYDGFAGYCPGQDEVSRSIALNGIWEEQETALFLDILNTTPSRKNIVLDFGAHIGWYSVLAGWCGYKAFAFDGDKSNIEIIEANAILSGCSRLVQPVHCWIDSNSPELDYESEENARILKCDLEGQDGDVVRIAANLFRLGKIDYAMIEISPVFAGKTDYPEMVEFIADCGYRVYCIPDKSHPEIESYMRNPLGFLKNTCELPKRGRKEFVRDCYQRNFLFEGVYCGTQILSN